MSYTHLSTIERGRLQAYVHLGYSSRRISKMIDRHHATISSELKRYGKTAYDSELAQNSYTLRRKSSVPTGKYSDRIADLIEAKLTVTWLVAEFLRCSPERPRSPEQIAHTTMLGKIRLKRSAIGFIKAN